ncbi:MAG: hypothetical protein DMF77_20460 [Acidobacteria bacterium]|nr:MAG: hypothetical protein DMF77_20460 [Acidobacteriota bacterium]
MRRHRRQAIVARAREPVPARKAAPAPESLARVENSLYLSIQAIKKKHKLERLGIAFYDSQTTLNWSYNADAFFHAASTIKLAVLAGVYGEVFHGRLTADAPVHVRNKFASIVDGRPFALNLEAEPTPSSASPPSSAPSRSSRSKASSSCAACRTRAPSRPGSTTRSRPRGCSSCCG